MAGALAETTPGSEGNFLEENFEPTFEGRHVEVLSNSPCSQDPDSLRL